MRPPLLLLPATLGVALALASLPADAAAETIKLRSGRMLQVDEVALKERAVSITVRADGGTARVDLRFERIDPAALLAIVDRETPADDGAGRLRAARVALEFGLRSEAAERFRQAAALDPALADERDAGLATIRALESAEALVDLESHLRGGGDPREAAMRAAALLDGPVRASLSPEHVQRIEALHDLALRLVERQQAKQAAAVAKAVAAPPPPAIAPPGAQPAAPLAIPAALAARIHAEEVKALHAREAAADPKLSPRRAIRHLETAARALQSGRRVLRGLPAALQAAVVALHERFRELLTATYLDLADLYRQIGRYTDARGRVRAVLILDPGNEQAHEQRRLIEDDLRRDPYDGYGPEPYGVEIYDLRYVPGFGYVRSFPYGSSLHGSSFHGGRYRYGPRVRYSGAWLGVRLGHTHLHAGYAHHHHGGTRRVVGTRRTP